MIKSPLQLLLADDDADDCYLFKEAVSSVHQTAQVSTVHDGASLMKWLTRAGGNLPDILFLDINMPRKNGYECLTEIKADDNLAGLPVIMYSTSLDPNMVNRFYEKGALLYIQKPAEFTKLISVINKALTHAAQINGTIIARNQFVVTP